MTLAESLSTIRCDVDSGRDGELVCNHLPGPNVECVMATRKLGDPQILLFITNTSFGAGTADR